MKHTIYMLFSIIGLGCVFSGCVVDTGTMETVLGNVSFSRGDWQDATVHYLKAQKSTGTDQAWVSYNLGNVFHALGELDAALRLWNSAALSRDPDLRFNVFFNRGIALYEAGRFDESYSNFREALMLNPSNIDAKRNVELTQKKVHVVAAPAALGVSTTTTIVPVGLSEESIRVLEYIRRKEGQTWVPGASSGVAPAVLEDW